MGYRDTIDCRMNPFPHKHQNEGEHVGSLDKISDELNPVAGERGALGVDSKQKNNVSDADLYLWWKVGLGPQGTEQHRATRSRFSGEQGSMYCSPGPSPIKSQWLVTVYNE